MKLTLIITLLALSSFAQNNIPFSGKLVYEIEMVDTSLQAFYPKKYMTVYTNDTLVRIENETKQFGTQIVIKHTFLNKSYLLLNDGVNKFAIQTDFNKEKTEDSLKFKTAYKKKWGKTNILQLKAKRANVQISKDAPPLKLLYLKNYSTKYIDAYADAPGLPVSYFLESNEGLVKYQLIFIENKKMDRDLFGIPSDFKKVSFDQFIELMYKNQNNETLSK